MTKRRDDFMTEMPDIKSRIVLVLEALVELTEIYQAS
jgi:hypothetical protein